MDGQLRQKLLTIIGTRFGFEGKLPYTLDDLVNLEIEELTKIATMDENDIELYYEVKTDDKRFFMGNI